ncbi:MAG: multi-sensor signal transduction histidine kinase [Bryobacterales bacterium]|nr:multi-sensor signal transduction histidine kinase [Bryobacterales bacterium]
MAIRVTDTLSDWQLASLLAGCVLAIAGLITLEASLGRDVPLGGFYLLPLIVASAYLPRWATFLGAIATALAREAYGPFGFAEAAPQRLALTAVAFTGGALFAGELVRNRRMSLVLLRKSEQELRLRSDAEQEARALVETSPAGVLTVDSQGRIARANDAASRMLGFTESSPEGELVARYIPVLARLQESPQAARLTRTMVEASGHRRNGETFFGQAWVSAYSAASGPCLAVILLDVTEQVRDREEGGLKQLLSNSRIVAGAVSHELRNLAAAATVLHHNLTKTPGLNENPDFRALGTVVESALKLSSTELSDSMEEVLEGVDVAELLEELRAIVSPGLEEASIQGQWEIHKGLPGVRVDRSGLLQVFLNLAKNSISALRGRPEARLRITAYGLEGTVVIRVSDNGPGIPAADRLFQPFQPGASSTGLGLFVSRAIIRTFGGELHQTQQPGECTFIVELPGMR